MTAIEIQKTLEAQRAFFKSGKTKNIDFRISQLKKLKTSIKKYENQLCAALKKDLNKCEFESYATEIGFTLSEISDALKHLKSWAKPKKVATPLAHFPSKSRIYSEPFGVTLVMSPWNYPAQLALTPLIAAISAGNCVMLKPSNYSPTVSDCLMQIITDCFEPQFVSVVLGGRAENTALLEQQFDFIFFTGGTTVGHTVMQAASKYLTPIVLELGGKSPCIVDKTANIKLAAKRIAWGKFINAGQTCVAPDYVYAHESILEQLLRELKNAITELYGENPIQNPDLCKMISQKHFERVSALIIAQNNQKKSPKIVCGGKTNTAELKIEPTVITDITWEHPVMQEEIFGPVLPVLTFSSYNDLVQILTAKPKPLALYHFTNNKENEQKILHNISHGGGCINDTVVHLATPNMPFGGVGNSGMGGYHGKFGFDTFSHKKSILKKSTLLDLPMRYAPYKKLYLQIIKLFMN